MERKQKKILIASVAVLVALVAAFAVIYSLASPKTPAENPQDGTKTVTLTVDFGDGKTEKITLKTTGSSLRSALESEKGLISGDESEYGLFITAVRGVTADSSKQQWWCITKGGETVMTGVDDTAISDGECYEITLKTGY